MLTLICVNDKNAIQVILHKVLASVQCVSFLSEEVVIYIVKNYFV